MSCRGPREFGTAKPSEGDSVARAGTLTFAPGETTKASTIEVKGDSQKEANETFSRDPCTPPARHRHRHGAQAAGRPQQRAGGRALVAGVHRRGQRLPRHYGPGA